MATFTRTTAGNHRALIRKRGRVMSKTFSRKADAQRWARETELSLEQADAGLLQTKNATLADLIDAYMEGVVIRSVSTAQALRSLRNSLLGPIRLKHLNYAHFDRYVEKRLQTAKPSSVRVTLMILNKPLRWAKTVKRLDVDTSLAKDAVSRMRFAGHELSANARNRVLSQTELQALYDHWAKSKRRKLPMAEIVAFAVETCCRVGEICSVVAQDYDPVAKTLWVRKRKNPGAGFHDTNIPLSALAVEIVEARIAAGHTGLLFPHAPAGVSLAFKRAAAKLKLSDVTFHDLRHTGCTRYAQKGLKMHELQLISGHRTQAALARYVNLGPEDVHRRLAELEAERQRLIATISN